MSTPTLVATDFGGTPGAPALILGPSLGTSAAALWNSAAQRLSTRFRVYAFDLPGHGHTPTGDAVTMADLASAVRCLADGVSPDHPVHYAGDSVGGCIGLQLLLDAGPRIATATLISTGTSISTPAAWRDRAASVRAHGTAGMAESAQQRWFAPDFALRSPETVAALLDSLRRTHDEGYAQVCEALAGFDVSDRLGEIAVPILCIAGGHDVATPPEALHRIASGVVNGRVVVLPDVAHLPPAEAPLHVADLIASHADPDVYTAGILVRREVLGDTHVDRAISNTTEFTSEFQDLITRYAWGSIWTRPGLDRRSRSMITLTALIARGHHDELAMHVRAARRNNLTVSEIEEVLLQTAIYCGVPDANTAFRIASRVLNEEQ